jgi:hypothetical protein
MPLSELRTAWPHWPDPVKTKAQAKHPAFFHHKRKARLPKQTGFVGKLRSDLGIGAETSNITGVRHRQRGHRHRRHGSRRHR